MSIFGFLLPPWISLPLAFIGKLFGMIPAKAWPYIGLAVALMLLHLDLEHRAVQAAVAKNEAKHAKIDAERAAAQKKADALAQKKLDDARTQNVQLQLDRNDELAAAEAKRVADLADLRKRMPAYVSHLTLPDADVPRGYILWRSAAAAFANGADGAAPPGPAEGSLDGPSGIPFATLAETDAAQADAFRAAVAWGRGWQTYARDLKAACETDLSILTTKGASP